jgi:hypothetical protein
MHAFNSQDAERLHQVAMAWSDRLRPVQMPKLKVTRLHAPGYDGDNPYNGFSGAERRRRSGLTRLLQARNIVARPQVCALCGSEKNVGYHGENYFDAWSMIPICPGCHGTLHRRFKAPEKWLARLDAFQDSPAIEEFRALPLVEVNYAAWLRENIPGPHDPVEQLWPGQGIEEYKPRLSREAAKIKSALIAVNPTETEWKLLRVLAENPGVTSGVLSREMGYAGANAWHLQFGRFCRKLDPALGPAPIAKTRTDDDGEPAKFFIGLLADFNHENSSFTLKPAAQAALASI